MGSAVAVALLATEPMAGAGAAAGASLPDARDCDAEVEGRFERMSVFGCEDCGGICAAEAAGWRGAGFEGVVTTGADCCTKGSLKLQSHWPTAGGKEAKDEFGTNTSLG